MNRSLPYKTMEIAGQARNDGGRDGAMTGGVGCDRIASRMMWVRVFTLACARNDVYRVSRKKIGYIERKVGGFMKKRILIILFAVFILSACSVRESVSDLITTGEKSISETYEIEQTTGFETETETEIETKIEIETTCEEEITTTAQSQVMADYAQVYIDIINELELESKLEYSLIYLNEDDIPELVAGKTWYYVSVYTYVSGELYVIIDNWGYGIMGNHGYEYIPKKNVIRNYDSDLAGAIVNEFYGRVDENYEIQSYYDDILSIWMFKDINDNYMPDEEEYDENDTKSYFYLGKKEITQEEYDSYVIKGDYALIVGYESASEIIAKLESVKG